MKKNKLNEAVISRKTTTREALQLLWDNVNKGQKKQILKNEEVKSMTGPGWRRRIRHGRGTERYGKRDL